MLHSSPLRYVPTLLLILAAIFALWPAFVLGQSFDCVSQTSNNATVIFPETTSTDIEGQPMMEGQRLTAHGEDGRCVGSITWNGSAQALTVWGADSFAHAGDGATQGLEPGEEISFRLYDATKPSQYHELSVTLSTDSDLFRDSPHYVINGVYKVDAVQSKNLRVESKELSAPSPNPFTHRTSVTLSLERSQHVQVSVYNVLGRHVAELHNGRLDNGASTLEFDANNLSSGTYIIVARGEHFLQTRQVTLVQ